MFNFFKSKIGQKVLFVILGAFAPMIASITWRAGGNIYDWYRVHQAVKAVSFQIPVDEDGLYKLRDKGCFRCLLIRYGADEVFGVKGYLSSTDVIDGQRRFEIIEANMEKIASKPYFIFDLPIHKYLGTQFKCFVEPNPSYPSYNIALLESDLKSLEQSARDRNKTNNLSASSVNALESTKGRCSTYEINKDQNKSANFMSVDRGGKNWERMFFLIDKFQSVGSGYICNNFVPPE